MPIGAGFNPHFFSKDTPLALPPDVALIEAGLRELSQIPAGSPPVSLHMARSPITEDPAHHPPFFENIRARIQPHNILSIGLHLMGKRSEGIGQLGFTSQFTATPETVARSIRFITSLSEALARPVWIENANFYTEYPDEIQHNWNGVRDIIRATGARLILDIPHLLIESHNLGLPPAAALGLVPWEAVVEVHLSGCRHGKDGSYHDAHNIPVPEEVWELLETCNRMGLLRDDLFITIEHTDPEWIQHPDTLAADFARLRRFLPTLRQRPQPSDASRQALRYAHSYLGKVIASYVEEVREACEEVGSTYEAELDDWITRRVQQQGYRLTITEEELYDGNDRAVFAPADFVEFLQEKYPA